MWLKVPMQYFQIVTSHPPPPRVFRTRISWLFCRTVMISSLPSTLVILIIDQFLCNFLLRRDTRWAREMRKGFRSIRNLGNDNWIVHRYLILKTLIYPMRMGKWLAGRKRSSLECIRSSGRSIENRFSNNYPLLGRNSYVRIFEPLDATILGQTRLHGKTFCINISERIFILAY